MQHITITQLKKQSEQEPISASLDVQVQQCITKETKSGKPYLLITLTDSLDQFSLKVWENLPQFKALQEIPKDAFIRLDGDWVQNQYGIDSPRWQLRLLNQGEIDDFLIGDPATKAQQQSDWDDIYRLTNSIKDPRLHQLCTLFFQQYKSDFVRAAAARKNHHARRGGLVEHVAQMMRCANAICSVYKSLNRDLLITGVLFHDCGKLWENNYPEQGFTQPHDLEGEMLGHIPIGIGLVDDLWRQLMQRPESDEWSELTPANNLVRIHLLHLIASHHGTHEFGSPTLPRTPEAHALHHVDNLDAKYEMMKQAYEKAPELAPGIQEKQFPLPANLIKPLPKFPHTDKAQEALIVEDEFEVKPFDGELF